MNRSLPVLGLVGLLVGMGVTSAWSHHTPNNFDPAVYGATRDPGKLRYQLESGVRLVERTLAFLADFDANRDPQSVHAADHFSVEAYYFLRAGLASLTFQKDHPLKRTGFVDPVIPLATARVDRANHLVRNARTDINYVTAGDLGRLGPAIEKLNAAIAETQIALQLIF